MIWFNTFMKMIQLIDIQKIMLRICFLLQHFLLWAKKADYMYCLIRKNGPSTN